VLLITLPSARRVTLRETRCVHFHGRRHPSELGDCRLAALLLYGSGLRLMGCLTLRVKDVDFGLGQITVRAGKGDKDRVTMLPDCARGELESPFQGR
jgi:site-specific recombinase XerD